MSKSLGPLTIVCPTFYPELIGTPAYATDMARWFRNAGWDVEVVTAQPFYPEFKRHRGYGHGRRRDLLDDAIPILRLPTIVPRHGRPLWRLLSDANFMLQGCTRARRYRRHGAVISISPGTPWVALVGKAFSLDGRHVALIHDVQSGLASALGLVPSPAQSLIRASERASLNQSDIVAALTEEMMRELVDIGVKRPAIVSPLWSTISADSALVQRSNPSSFQYSGNFGEKQGMDQLIAVARELSAAEGHFQLVLRGAGKNFESIRDRMSSQTHRQLEIVYEAPVAEGDLPTALAKSAVHFVFSATGTGRFVLPSKIINALVAGCIVVAAAEAKSTVARLSDELLGLVAVAPGDSKAFADAAISIARRPDLDDYRRRSQKQAAARFDRDHVLAALEGLIQTQAV